MKTLPAALKSLLQSEVITIAWMWRVTRRDGVVFGFTTHVSDLVYLGVTYLASSGFLASDISGSDSLAVDNLEIQGVLNSDSIVETDLRAGRWDLAALEIFFVNYNDLSMGSSPQFSGTTGAIQTGRLSFTAEQRGLTQPLSQNVGILTSPVCRAQLGDSKCQVNLVPMTRTGTIGSVVNPNKFTDAARTEADNWWTFGNLTFTSGLSTGLKIEVKRSLATGMIELVLPPFFGFVVGDTYSMTPGCNKLLKINNAYTGDCKVKFNNVINNQSEPEVPGQDRITQYGGRTSG